MDKPSPDGKEGPLATLTGARNRVREIKAQKERPWPIDVLFRGGEYPVTETVVFTLDDSTSYGRRVTYEAYPKEKPIFTGGRKITGWRKEDKFWVADIPDAKEGKFQFDSLWVNGERRTPARTPNEGEYFSTGGRLEAVKDPATGQMVDRNNIALSYRKGDMKQWKDIDDALVVVFHSWETSEHRIASLDEENSVATFTSPLPWAFGQWGQPRYYVSHIFEGLDQPGEWYLDRNEGKLYYIPMRGEKIGKIDAVATNLQQMIRFEGNPAEGKYVENLHFRGLQFEYTDFLFPKEGHADGQAAYSVEGAIQAKGIRDCSFEQCRIAHTGTHAIWLAEGCQGNRIVQNEMTDLGAGGVKLGKGESPATSTLATEHNLVDNNFIHDGGKVFRSGIGVWIGRSSYNTVSHNEICDLTYSGMSVGWSWGYDPTSANHNIIEYNHIHHIGRGVLSDMGGIYLLGQAPGTILRNNLIHDVKSYSYGGWGIYHDEGSSDLLDEDNIVYNCKSGGFHQHYGKENRMRNNIFAMSTEAEMIRTREEPHTSFFFEGNIVYSLKGPILGSNWSNDHFVMDRNCYWIADKDQELDFAGRSLRDWRKAGHDRNSIIADPLFVDAKHYDFRLRNNSPAIKQLGFVPIDMSNVGLYGPRGWKNAPKRVKHYADQPDEKREAKPISLDFEDLKVGMRPMVGYYSSPAPSLLQVTDETAASGTKSLLFQDAEGIQYPWDPSVTFAPQFDKGMAFESFDVKLEAGARFWTEWRTLHSPYRVGPSVLIDGEGNLTVAAQPPTADSPVKLKVPLGQWIHIEIECMLGKPKEPGAYNLIVTLPGEAPKRFDGIKTQHAGFNRLDWLGFLSMATGPTKFYLDNLKLELKK